MGERTVREPRAKISVTLERELLQAVDAFVASHPQLDRSKVIDEALQLWCARQQDKAMERQFAEAEPVPEAERLAWRAVRRAAAGRRLGSG